MKLKRNLAFEQRLFVFLVIVVQFAIGVLTLLVVGYSFKTFSAPISLVLSVALVGLGFAVAFVIGLVIDVKLKERGITGELQGVESRHRF